MKKVYFYQTVIGEIAIAEMDGMITDVFFPGRDSNIDKYTVEETKLLKKAFEQIEEYLNSKRQIFDLPLKFDGTDFQIKVWKELLKIPYGKTMTYKEIAKLLGNTNYVRAVGNANNKNKISIIIPCHRVIGSSGKLVGYAGGLDLKEKLINLEKNYSE